MKFTRTWLCVALALAAAVVMAVPAAASEGPTGSLKFLVQPSRTAINNPILGGDFSTGQPLEVALVDSEGTVITGATGSVTMALAPNPAGGVLSGTLTEPFVNGVATFGDLSIDKAGLGYVLLATSPGDNSTASRGFNVVDAGVQCNPDTKVCSDTASTPTSSLTITAPSGTTTNLSVAYDVGTPLTCTGYTPMDANWFTFTSTSTSAGKVVTYRVRPAGPGTELVGRTQFCLGAPYEFETSTGTLAPPSTLPDGSSGFTGLLPRCKATSHGPCVLSKGTVPDDGSPTGFDIVLKVNFPSGLPGDPWGRM